MRTLLLNGSLVRQLLGYPECIDLMELALGTLARGDAVQPLRQVLAVPNRPTFLVTMPGWSGRPEILGIKVLSVMPENRETEGPSHQGFVALFDVDHGAPVALVDASALTEIRTAAVSALATRLLSREDARTLTIVGTGLQAGAHARAIPRVRSIERLLLWGRRPERAQALAAQLGPMAEVATDLEAAVRSADILCTTTASRVPLVDGAWLKRGAHVNAVGASAPGFRELTPSAVRACRTFVDRRESAWAEADELRIPRAEGTIGTDHVVGELGEVLLGSVLGRRAPREITLFKSVGLAIEDLFAARRVYERAVEAGAGQSVEL